MEKISAPRVPSYYWFTKSELEFARTGNNLEQGFGLPISSHAIEYDIYRIEATSGANIFESTIAPTLQNGYSTTGGRTQSLVLDRGAWSAPQKIDTFMP